MADRRAVVVPGRLLAGVINDLDVDAAVDRVLDDAQERLVVKLVAAIRNACLPGTVF